MEIAAVVVSLPERLPLLAECLEAIRAQTRPPDDTVVGIDPYRLGEVGNQNRLLDATTAEWVAFCHDDDLWYPNHLETCEKLFDNADVVVSRYELVGRPVDTIEPWHEDFNDLRVTNWIGSPSMVCVRRSMFGRWNEPCDTHRWVDWCNWNRMMAAGARFADTGVVTTQYRFHAEYGNGSWTPR